MKKMMCLLLCLCLFPASFAFAESGETGLRDVISQLMTGSDLAQLYDRMTDDMRAAVSQDALGALWGFVPCTLVYSVLPLALFAGGAWEGALVMMVFGIGTLPHLVGAGFALSHLNLKSPELRRVAAVVIGAFALVGLYRAVFVPQALGHGPFCLF